MIVSARAAEVYHHYAPRGHFRPWALLRFPEFTRDDVCRLSYPTLTCAGDEHVFLHDMRTCSLVQMINIRIRTLRNVDVNERHAFVCEADVVHVFSRPRESGNRGPAHTGGRHCTAYSERRGSGPCIRGLPSLSPPEYMNLSPRPEFIAAQVSRDGRDPVVLSRIVFILTVFVAERPLLNRRGF